MDPRTLRLLEYEKIREMLRGDAASSLGQELISRMRPARDAMVVRARLDETTQARAALNAHGDVPLGGLHDIRESLARAVKGGVLSALELLDIAETAMCIRRLRRYLVRTDAYPTLKAQGRLLGEYPALEQAVEQAISPRGEVLDTASTELARARKRIRALHDSIQRELQRIISSPSSQDLLQEPIVTQRNGRFCVPVRAEARHAFKGIVHDLSASGQTAFVEPLLVVELGNDLREAENQEREEMHRVLASLSAKAGAANGLLPSLEAAARLDVMFARARFANALDAVEPVLNTVGIIELRQARHPLLGAQAVPIDILLGEDGRNTLLITGPNTGGKTVTLKTVGLFCLMMQSGMHVPALEGSALPIFEQIFADIGDEQSIEQSLSTFSGHMTAIVRIVKEAGPRALVLFDEIGAGTDPAEGAALGKAILLELLRRGCRTIATTHYGELKVFAQSTEGFLNASVEFDLETLRPTYRIITGLPGSSNALAISQRLGLPKELVARAKELMGTATLELEQTLKQAEGVRRALDRERSASARAAREHEQAAAELQRQLREIEEGRGQALSRARQQAQEIVQKARQEANTLLDELKSALKDLRTPSAAGVKPDIGQLRKQSREVIQALTTQVQALPLPPAPPHSVRDKPVLARVEAGQEVYVRSVGHRGQTLSAGQGEESVEVQVGIMRMSVPVHDLEAVSPVWRGEITLPTPPAMINPEIHLLGLRAEEAATRLEDYLYTAFDEGLARVRIVHGHGTGVLRKVVQDVLRHHPTVTRYRAGEPQEGGAGVTIAEVGRPG